MRVLFRNARRRESYRRASMKALANSFFLGQLLFRQSQSLGTIACAAVSRDRFVKSKNARSFSRSLFRIFETLFMIAGLNVVMGQLLNRTGKLLTIALQVLLPRVDADDGVESDSVPRKALRESCRV